MTNRKRPVGTSSLAKPSFDKFLEYSDLFLSAGQYSNNGPCVQLLEKRLAEFHQCNYCITFSSGFWALVIVLDSVKLHGRSEILMPSLTYRRMADLVSWAGLRPVYYDIDPLTLTTTHKILAQKINENIAVVLGVHPIVNCFPTKAIRELCNQHKIPLVMDSVESAYEISEKEKVGAQANVEIFSMHASKLLNGCEGGYATTNDQNLCMRLSTLRGFGFEGRDSIKLKGGINAKLNEMHAAMALANLDSLAELVDHNREIYNQYKQEIAKIRGIYLVLFNEQEKTSYKNIVIRVGSEFPISRDKLLDILNHNTLLARPYYSPPLHIKHEEDYNLPCTEACALNHIVLPSGYQMTKESVIEVCDLIRGVPQDDH